MYKKPLVSKFTVSTASAAFSFLLAPAVFAQTSPGQCASIEDMYAPEGCVFQSDRTYSHSDTGAQSTSGRIVAHAFEGTDGVRSSDLALVGGGYDLKVPGASSASPEGALTTIPQEARDALDARGVDIVYFDFSEDNDNFAQAKSYVLQDAIRDLNDWRADRGEAHDMIYIGLSLGGVVGRHALRSLELSGYDHRVRTMFTWDSPHLGANVPVPLQNMPREMARGARRVASNLRIWLLGLGSLLFRAQANALDAFASEVEAIVGGMIGTPASKQLIINYSYNDDLAMHDYGRQLHLELAEMGMPELSYNVAVAAGGIYQNSDNDQRKPKYFDFDGTMSGLTMSFDVWRDDSNPYLQTFMGASVATPYESNKRRIDSLDTVPCSSISLPGVFSKFLFSELEARGFSFDHRSNYETDPSFYDSESCFVPTLSSLGVGDIDILTQSIPTLSELEELSPFDELYAGHRLNYDHNSTGYWQFQDSFEEHLEYTYAKPAQGPCAQICGTPVVIEQASYQSGNLGTAAVCIELPENLHGLTFGGFASPREFALNGELQGTEGWSNNLPPALNGGYCVSAPEGNNSWAWFATW